MLPPTHPTSFVLVAANIASNPTNNGVPEVIMIRKSRVFFTWLRSRTYGSETGQLSRLNQRCSSVLSKATRRCTRIQTRAEDETTMRGGAINNARQWLEQREERRIMAIPPMQPLPLARLALIPFLSSPLLLSGHRFLQCNSGRW